jgi:hypothetical protein
MNTLLIAATLALAADDAPKKPLSARPAALVMEVKGRVTVEGRGGKPRRVEEGAYLLPGETVSAAPGGEALLLFLVKGEQRRLGPGGRATLTRDGCDPDAAARRVGKAKLPRKNLTRVREVEVREGGGVGVVRGGEPPAEARITPLYGTFVAGTRPAFAWPPVEKAEGYVVELKDGGGRRWKAVTKQPKLEYPAKEKPLEHGQKYLWTVKAKLPDGDEKTVVDESNFKVLLEGEDEELKPVRKLAASDAPQDLLLAAAAYEGYGLLDEALKTFEKLAKKQPKVARYQRALARYYRYAGRPDKAKEAEERARKLEAAKD